jgi:hypothetical protein
MSIEVLHGLIADSYHLLLQTGGRKSIVTITKEQAQEVANALNIPIKNY